MRGKHKRKKQRQKASPRSEYSPIPAAAHEESPTKPESQSKRDDDKSPSMRFLKPFVVAGRWLKSNYKVTLESIAVVGGLSVLGVYILQWRVMERSLRVDQRPWIRITADIEPLHVGAPVIAHVHLTNVGKSPASLVAAQAALEMVKNGKEPEIDYSVRHDISTVGALWMNDVNHFDTARL